MKNIELKPYHILPLLSIILVTIGSSFFTSYMSLKLQYDKYNILIISIIQSSYYVGMLIGSLMTEYCIRVLGYILLFFTYAIIAANSILLQAIHIDFITCSLLRIIFGICFAGFYVIIEGWLLAKSKPNTQNYILSIYSAVLLFSQALSHYILNFVSFKNLFAYIISAFFISLSTLPFIGIIKHAPQVENLKANILKDLLGLFLISHIGTLGCFVSGMLLGLIYSLAPNFAQSNDLDVTTFMQLIIIGGCTLPFICNSLKKFFRIKIFYS